MRFLRFFAVILLFCIAGTLDTFAQSNPSSAFDLSTGNYSMTSFPATSAAGTYPPNMIFHYSATLDPDINAAMTGDWTAAYNLTSASRFVGKDDATGINLANTSGINSGQGFIGAVVASLNATGRANIQVSFLCGMITQSTGGSGPKVFALRLQYRTSTAAAWSDVPGPVEYSTAGLVNGTTQTVSATLPVDANNQALVQLRWKYYSVSLPAGSGRPTIRLDDISVSSSSSLSTPTKFLITGITPSTPSSTSTFSATVQSVDNGDISSNVATATSFTLSRSSGTGTLGGTLTGTIPAGSSAVVLTGITYTTAESNVQITATRTAGDNLTAGTSGLFTVGIGASTAIISNLQTAGNANKRFRSFTVEARRPDNSVDASYVGTVTLAKVSGAGTLGGTLTKTLVNGVATFTDITFSSAGTYIVSATTTGLPLAQSSQINVYGRLTMTELMIPRFMKSATSTTRIPTFALIRLDSLIPNTTYRYFTGAVTTPTQANTIGGGVNLHYDATTQTYVSNSNRSLTSLATDYSTFTTSAGQTSLTIWVNMLPSGNAAFNEGNSIYWRIIMTDTPVAGIAADTFNTTSTTRTLEFGNFSTNGTGIHDVQSGLAPKTYVVLFDDVAGTGNPISTALVQDDGTTVAAGTTVPFYANLESVSGGWSTIIPNNLPTGIRRVEHRRMDGVLLNSWNDIDGIWAGVSTVSQNTGTTPINFQTPQLMLIAPVGGEQYCTRDGANIRWVSRGIQRMMIEFSRNNSPFSPITTDADGFAQAYNWAMGDITDSTTSLRFRLTDFEHQNVTATSGPTSAFNPTVITVHPASQNTCSGDSIVLIVRSSGNVLKYQWQKDGADILGATERILTLRNVTVGASGFYTCNVVGFGPCGTTTTKIATIFVTPPIQIIKQPEDQTFAIGSTATIKVDVIGTNNHTFQWYRGTVPVQNSTRISGAQEATLIIRNFQSTDAGSNYYCVIAGSLPCGTATTRTVRVGGGGITITATRDTIVVCEGQTAQMFATGSSVTVLPVGTGLTYQWSRNGNPIVQSAKYSNPNLANWSISSTTKADAGVYTLRVTAPSIGGIENKSVYLQVVTTARFKTRPEAVIEVCANGTYNLSVEPTDSVGVSYRWLKNGVVDTASRGKNLTGKILTSGQYDTTVVVTTIISTLCSSDTSMTEVRLIPKPTIIAQHKALDTVRSGGTIFIGISAVSKRPLSYRWRKDGKMLDGVFTPQFSKTGVVTADSGTYECLVINECDTTIATTRIVVIRSSDITETRQFGYELEQSVPNPATNQASVTFTLPEETIATLTITDLLGRVLFTSELGLMSAGTHSTSLNLETYTNGVYFYTLTTPKVTLNRRLEIVK
ncbi:MAG: immunoglobulin domain-containing protein [Ignavibacteria bacterium]|nr:immunoglobulin domain-containing protein [Ignavibacteria bacterium]